MIEVVYGQPAGNSLKKQLRAFYYSLLAHGMEKEHCPADWLEAFFYAGNASRWSFDTVITLDDLFDGAS